MTRPATAPLARVQRVVDPPHRRAHPHPAGGHGRVRSSRVQSGRVRGSGLRDDAGAATPSAVLTFPALLLGLMLIVQFSLYLHASSVAEAAAQDAAAQARRADGTTTAAREAAQRALATLGPKMLQGTAVSVERSETTARVVVTGDVASLVPGLRLAVTEGAQGPVERYVYAPAGEGAVTGAVP